MRQMIQVKSEEGKFKFRVSGILKSGNKILTVDMDNSGFLCLPGGYVELGEDTETALLREMKEEVKYSITVDRCIAIIENFFVNKKGITMHEVAFYYLLTTKDDDIQDYSSVENDNGGIINHSFHWINLDEIAQMDFRPAILKEKLSNHDFSLSHIIYKEN